MITSSLVRPRVLCVDDEPRVLAGLRLHLRREYEVEVAEGGEQALEIINQRGPFAVVISDMRMPYMNGAAFFAQARVLAPDTVRILLTGYSDIDDAIAAINQGQIFRFLTKPCRPAVLRHAVEDAVAQYRMITADHELVRREVDKISHQLLHTERLATLGTMASGVGHELNNMAAVFNSLVHALEQCAQKERPPSAEDLEDLNWVAERLTMHGRQLLNMGRPQRHHTETLDLRELVRRTIERLELTGKLKTVQLQLDLHPTPLKITGKAGQLEQVLINLCLNAVDAIDDHGTRPGRVHVSLGTDTQGGVWCKVTDNGVGIPQSDLGSIFEPYFTTKSDDRGTGLGLSVCRQIVVEHDGELKVESQVGEGTTMTMTLPNAEPDTEPVSEPGFSLDEDTIATQDRS
jgi:signal transduction histidine kinase